MSNQTFLPEDYVAKKAEGRTNLICVILFLVVMAAVLGAFLVTNQQSARIKEQQRQVNVRYQQAALQIEKLNELEKQKEAMLTRAELAAALVERVPRSILLAELINRMPARLGLLEFTLSSEQVKRVRRAPRSGTGSLKGPQRGRTKEEAQETSQKIEPPRYDVFLTLVGAAPTDLEVSRYLAELNAYPLVREVVLEYSEERRLEGRLMREFKIKMKLDATADVRNVEPLIVPSMNNPMTDTIEFGTPRASGTVSADPVTREGQ